MASRALSRLSCSISLSICSVSCLVSETGCQFHIANKRRQGCKVPTHVDRSEQPLVMGRVVSDQDDVVIALVRDERNPEETGAGEQR
jgi:hypothetical protein